MPNIPINARVSLLRDLKNEMLECRRCYISENWQCNVFGEGSPTARIMSVSEAAGEDERLAAAPYRGKAGRMWEQALSAIGWDRKDLYVCNAVCGQPPKNTLSEDLIEVDSCNYYLTNQIDIVRPKLIVAFGKTASYALKVFDKKTIKSAKFKMKDAVGKQYEYILTDGIRIPVILTYHPSYILRQSQFSFDLFLHLSLAQDVYASLEET